MATSEEIKQMFKRKMEGFDKRDIGMAVGAALHDAVAISTAKLGKERASLVTRENYQEEIEFWLDWLLQLSQEKKDYLSIPVVEPEIVSIIDEPMAGAKQWDAKKREIDDIKVEEEMGKDLPF